VKVKKVERERKPTQFTKENLLVGVEGVDDEVEQLGDLGL
jgi:hypothetical protein